MVAFKDIPQSISEFFSKSANNIVYFVERLNPLRYLSLNQLKYTLASIVALITFLITIYEMLIKNDTTFYAFFDAIKTDPGYFYYRLLYLNIPLGMFFNTLFIFNYIATFDWSSDNSSARSVLPPYPDTYNDLQIVVGEVHDWHKPSKQIKYPEWFTIKGEGLYVGNACWGSTGCGKTASFLYCALENLFQYKYDIDDLKFAGLIADVKGDFIYQTIKYAIKYKRVVLNEKGKKRYKKFKTEACLGADDYEKSDLLRIAVGGEYVWNPLWRPNDASDTIASDMKTVLESLSGKSKGDSFWIDNAVKLLSNAIDLNRLYRWGENKDENGEPLSGYFTFVHIYKTINDTDEVKKMLTQLNNYLENESADRPWIKPEEISYLEIYFEKEWLGLDQKIRGIISNETGRMLSMFVKPMFQKTFCPTYKQIMGKKGFPGFERAINDGLIVVSDIPHSRYAEVSTTINVMLKLAFQKASLNRVSLAKEKIHYNVTRPLLFLNDEYQVFVSALDADFYDRSRQSKVITLVATQSLSSYKKQISDEETLKTIMDNLSNKIFMRTTSTDTAKWAAEIAGKQTIYKENMNVSENLGEGGYDSVLDSFKAKKSTSTSMSKSIQEQEEDIFKPSTFFSLDNFSGIIVQASDGKTALEPRRVYMKTYFQDKRKDYFSFMKSFFAHQAKQKIMIDKLQQSIQDLDLKQVYKILNLVDVAPYDDVIFTLQNLKVTINPLLDARIKAHCESLGLTDQDDDDLDEQTEIDDDSLEEMQNDIDADLTNDSASDYLLDSIYDQIQENIPDTNPAESQDDPSADPEEESNEHDQEETTSNDDKQTSSETEGFKHDGEPSSTETSSHPIAAKGSKEVSRAINKPFKKFKKRKSKLLNTTNFSLTDKIYDREKFYPGSNEMDSINMI
jgi:hypothetical protein